MDEINKDFDGVSWEWKGRRDIRGLKPICPKCQYELNIEKIGPKMKMNGGFRNMTILLPRGFLYSCPDCSFSKNSNIDDVDSSKDLRKAAQKEFERRQRLKASENTKD